MPKVLLGDGAMGTELQKRNLPPGICPEQCNLLYPDLVQKIHLEYFNAGSDVVETNTFGANRFRLQQYGLARKAREINLRAVDLARKICPKDKLVGGSIGPTGEIIEPLGSLSQNSAYEAFAEQAEALANGGVDIIYVETMLALEEIELAIRAVKETTKLPVIACMSFRAGKTGLRTAWGVSPADAVRKLVGLKADFVGANCGDNPGNVVAVIKEMRELTDKPLVAQPNAIVSQDPQAMQSYYEQLLKCGVGLLGGCCGTSPLHIKLMRKMVDEWNLV